MIQHDCKVLALLILAIGSTAGAQTVKRDTKVTGPKGNTARREIEIKRTPGSIERDVRITRPGGATYERETQISRAPARGPAPQARGGGGGGDRNIYIERNNYYGRPAPPPRGGGGGFNLFLGGIAPLPPPVVFVPEPIYVAPAPPPVVVQPPVRYAAPQPETVVIDPVAQALDRLESHHANSRRDGALTLGRLGDARAVGPLSERLQKDWDKDVRVAAAWALGEIGDPHAGVALQRAALYDKKEDVRDVAGKAIRKLDRPINDPNVQVVPEGAFDPTSTTELLPLPASGARTPGPVRSLDPPPAPQPPVDYPK